jgi:hypothetical protein
MSSIVALVSSEPRDELVDYLRDVGFSVRAFRAPMAAPREGTLVWLTEHDIDDRMATDTVRVWLGGKVGLRVILVSDRPVRLRDAADDPRGRVQVLPAPIFGWQLVDCLRDRLPGVS